MYKSKLQEFCLSRKIDMPEYTTMKEGVDQYPGFTAVVNVNGLSFTTPEFYRNSKEAHNQAAKLAFDHLTSKGSSIGNIVLPTAAASSSILQPKNLDSSQNAYFSQSTSMIKDDGKFKCETYAHRSCTYYYRTLAYYWNLLWKDFSFVISETATSSAPAVVKRQQPL